MLIVLGMWTFLIVYPAWSLGKLQEAARHMAQGKLQEKLDPTHLHGSFRQIAQDLNALGQGASPGRGAAAEVRAHENRTYHQCVPRH